LALVVMAVPKYLRAHYCGTNFGRFSGPWRWNFLRKSASTLRDNDRDGRLLWTRQWTYCNHKTSWNSLAKQLAAPKEGLISIVE
jgi:hypothetical protein